MPTPIRLLAEPESDQRTVQFYAVFPAPAVETVAECNPAKLFTGDPQTGLERTMIAEANALCAPSAVTWVAQRKQPMGAMKYASPGLHQATLRWGETIATTSFNLGADEHLAPPSLPILTLFEVKPAPDQPMEATVRVQVTGLAPDQEVQVDAGAGQLFALPGKDGTDAHGEWTVTYAKSGEYVVSVDVLDADGYWLGTLGQNPLEITPAGEEPASIGEPAPGVVVVPLVEVPTAAESEPPWLPYRYVRPMWGGVHTYRTPGGGVISRTLLLGTYLAVRAETVVGGAVWYQSTYGDWIAGSAVAHVQPSALRGIELPGGGGPPPPGGIRHGIVTAALLNVRARPGVSPDNPPIAQLPSGTAVTIYEEQSVAGAPWYRIGDNRWVYGLYVRIVEEPPPPQVRRGIVTASVLNVRARPGVSPDNPVIDQLLQGAEVTIYEERAVGGAPWYRIGTNRWVHSAYVRIVTLDADQGVLAAPYAPADAARLPVGWVVAASVNVRARPGVSAGNPVIGEVFHNQRLDILETTTVSGARWYRIGIDRWVIGQWVAVATTKPRPASIGANERWVGVNLSQQTFVAYEGATPVYAGMVATGLPATPTVQGVFRTWLRRPGGRMSGGSAGTGGYYYLEEVTWTCFFYSGYALHTAYWHDAFGRPRSHGCVNMTPYDAWWVYQWSAPGGANSPAVYVYWS